MDFNVKDRLELFLREQRISKREFERRIGASNGFTNSIRKGIGSEKLKSIREQFPTLNIHWLLYGEGEMINSNDNNSGNVTNIGTNQGTVNQGTGSEQSQNEEKSLYQKIVSLLEQQIEQLKQEKRQFLDRVGCSSYDEVSKKIEGLK